MNTDFNFFFYSVFIIFSYYLVFQYSSSFSMNLVEYLDFRMKIFRLQDKKYRYIKIEFCNCNLPHIRLKTVHFKWISTRFLLESRWVSIKFRHDLHQTNIL